MDMDGNIEYHYDECGEHCGGRNRKTGVSWFNWDFECPKCHWLNSLTSLWFGKEITCYKCGFQWQEPKMGEAPDVPPYWLRSPEQHKAFKEFYGLQVDN